MIQPLNTNVYPYQGARNLANFLLETYGKDSFAFMIDEGCTPTIFNSLSAFSNSILAGFMEQYGTVFANPGIAEKGSMNVNIDVTTSGGHSSVPPPHTVSATRPARRRLLYLSD